MKNKTPTRISRPLGEKPKLKPFFVVDIGNTSTKWGIANRDRILRKYEFPTKKFIAVRGHKAPKLNLPNLSGAIISSVVPAALPGVKKCLLKLGIAHPQIVSAHSDLGIGIHYPKPKEIGADRLANSVAAVALYGSPSIVIDLGSAVTFDIISTKGEYLGGAIAPGLRMITHGLHEQTALLPKISLTEPRSAIGKSTVSAMRIGAVIGYRGLVREILTAICRKMKVTPLKNSRLKNRKKGVKIIATGGHSTLIASKIPEIHYVNPQLTLEGLRILYQRWIDSQKHS